MKKHYLLLMSLCMVLSLPGCTKTETAVIGTPMPIPTSVPTEPTKTPQEKEEEENKMKQEEFNRLGKLFDGKKIAAGYKGFTENNPIYMQNYGADPYAIEYNGRVYFYMTADNEDFDANGELKTNSYGQIKSIRVVSTADFANYEDHGSIIVAGKDGACKWANNSWAPAACWKNINGQDKFFLYFADSGNGIGVLTADTPYGPFTDPLGHAIINRQTPNCANVLWLFDPAVLVDDDGTGYLYVGGGVPEGKASLPQTGRCVQLTDDMIGLACDPIPMDTPYLFEDSGIHKFNNKYYYSYCTNFNVDAEGTAKFGFDSGEIAVMVSDSPLGPFVYQERVLKNPGYAFGLGGNNHHCIFKFQDQWYITYHARTLEKAKNSDKGYRSTHVNGFIPNEDGTIGLIKMDKAGVDQLKPVNPYETNSAASGAILAGLTVNGITEEAQKFKCGKMAISGIESGSYLFVKGVDFGNTAPQKLIMEIRKTEDLSEECAVKIATGKPFSAAKGYGDISKALTNAKINEFVTAEFDIKESITEIVDLSFVFSGSGYEIKSWRFE